MLVIYLALFLLFVGTGCSWSIIFLFTAFSIFLQSFSAFDPGWQSTLLLFCILISIPVGAGIAGSLLDQWSSEDRYQHVFRPALVVFLLAVGLQSGMIERTFETLTPAFFQNEASITALALSQIIGLTLFCTGVVVIVMAGILSITELVAQWVTHTGIGDYALPVAPLRSALILVLLGSGSHFIAGFVADQYQQSAIEKIIYNDAGDLK